LPSVRFPCYALLPEMQALVWPSAAAVIFLSVFGLAAPSAISADAPVPTDAPSAVLISGQDAIVPPPPDDVQPLPDPMEDEDDVLAGFEPLLDPVDVPDLPGRADAPPPLQLFPVQSVFALAAGDGSAAPRQLGLKDIVVMALANNTEVKVLRLQPELAQQQVQFAKGAFDPVFTFQTQYSYSETPQNAQEYIATGGVTTETQTALLDQLQSLQASLDDLLAQIQGQPVSGSGTAASAERFTDPRTFVAENFTMNWGLGGKTPMGTQYQVGLNQLQARNDLNSQIPPSLFFPEYTTVFGLTLTQPLLKGFGPAANLAELRIARVQRRIGWYEWQQQVIRSLATAISLYVDLIFARENLRVREGAVDTARLLETQNIRRVRAGKMRPSDVWEAQTSLANNVDVALRAINGYVETQNNLKAQIFSAAQIEAGPTGRIEPGDPLKIPPVKLDRSAFLRDAFAKRPEYQRLVAAAEQEGIKVRFARNQVYPQVDLQASYGLTGLDADFGNSFDGAFGGQGPALAVGVVVSVPLGNQKERANLSAAKYRAEQAALNVQRGAIDITLELDTAMSLVETSRKQVDAASQTARSALLTAEAQEKLLEEGKATTFDVVRLQNDYADARSRELAALANLRKSVLRLSVARGTLLEELGVNLEDEARVSSPPGAKRRLTPGL